ncbi:TonB-dependent receptor [Magnetospirillum molischianum]|uniref:TonB-dependent hemin/siderophore receptor n=1 Tax=Magnetospirillum molischianum DSM 120 TaxID=1150626 RepID=H8FSS7_MAGML|nr:TonB-dependent receptor [Magnetospirillum molischianum]CCG41415.1 TonB-dependent hemin/siderophore receptor [Magnetospirillum molischianum DSM 120]
MKCFEQPNHRKAQAFAFLSALVALGGSDVARADDAGSALPETLVTASRFGEGITGASTTVISTEEIERSPGQTLVEILDRVPGIQVRSMYGGVNGFDANIDLRGFGSTASSNTLILLNGRRLNDNDSSSIDLGAINRANIERIEIIRGNAGAVLYGDGAVGGVINIITKNAANTPDSFSAEAGIGSLGYRQGTLTATRRVGATALSLSGSQTTSDGFRENNKTKQRNVMGEVRHTLDGGEVYLNISADDSEIGYPGSVSLAQIARGGWRGTSHPNDYGDKQAVNLALGGTVDLASNVELVIDGGLRHKDQQALFSSGYMDTSFTTISLTPRLNAETQLAGLPNRLTTGIDFYENLYDSDRSVQIGSKPYDRYHLQQRTVALYGQDTVAVRPDTDVSFGARIVHMAVSAVQRSSAPGTPYDGDDINYAAHLGIEHRFDDNLAIFGRLGRSLRLPNVDERVGMGYPTRFTLKPQTSQDVETGLRGRYGRLGWQSSVFLMNLHNELHADPESWVNRNLEPTRRYGSENSVSLRVTDTVRLKGGLSYTKAVFREGPFKGNDVPLVANWTGSAGVSWDAWEKYAVVDLDARYVGSRRADGDEANTFETIDPHTLVDLRIGGEIAPATWSFSIQNLFDQHYYDYTYLSSTYPMPGRTMIGRLGVKF